MMHEYIIKITFLIMTALFLIACPTPKKKNSFSRYSFTHVGVKEFFINQGDPEKQKVVDKMCPQGSSRACESGPFLPGNINNVVNPPDPNTDENCMECELDTTSSVPAGQPSEIPGHITISFNEGQDAKGRTWIHDRETGRTTSLLGPPPRKSTRDCGQGVNKLVKSLYGDDIYGHGYQWYDKLNDHPQYKPVSCEPEDCPAGAILVYNHHQPSPINNGTGDQYGHVEVAMPTYNGKVEACSDYCSPYFGGNERRRKLFMGAFVKVE